MVEHVAQRLAETGVGFDQTLVQLFGHPALQVFHRWAAVGLVMQQALLGRQLLVAAVRVHGVDCGQHFDDVAALLGKVLDDVD